jgi:hypothetical protein
MTRRVRIYLNFFSLYWTVTFSLFIFHVRVAFRSRMQLLIPQHGANIRRNNYITSDEKSDRPLYTSFERENPKFRENPEINAHVGFLSLQYLQHVGDRVRGSRCTTFIRPIVDISRVIRLEGIQNYKILTCKLVFVCKQTCRRTNTDRTAKKTKISELIDDVSTSPIWTSENQISPKNYLEGSKPGYW